MTDFCQHGVMIPEECIQCHKDNSLLLNNDITEFTKTVYHYQNTEFNIIADIFFCGSALKDSEGNKFSGAYPAGFMKRVKSAFKEVYPTNREDILHVCSGRLPSDEGMRLDIDPKYSPDYLNNAEDMKIRDESYFWVQSDTPYNDRASEKYYGKPLLNRAKCIREMARVCKVGGFVAILDQISPNSVPRNLKRIAIIGVTSVPNQDLRVFSVFQKIEK